MVAKGPEGSEINSVEVSKKMYGASGVLGRKPDGFLPRSFSGR